MTQHQRLLEMFSRKITWSNFELRKMEPPMYQYPTRIFELKAKGYNIVTTSDSNNHKKFYYTMKGRTDLFN